jgi:hypothetical protein
MQMSPKPRHKKKKVESFNGVKRDTPEQKFRKEMSFAESIKKQRTETKLGLPLFAKTRGQGMCHGVFECVRAWPEFVYIGEGVQLSGNQKQCKGRTPTKLNIVC